MLIHPARLAWSMALALTLPAAAHAQVWRSQGYGYLLVTNPAKVEVYDVAAGRCTLSDTVPGLASLGRIEQRGPDHFVLAGETTRIGFEKIPALPADCVRTAARDADPLVNFDALWTIFDENYAAFAERDVDWREMRSLYRPRVEALGTSGDPWPIFVEMLSRLHDPHVHLVAEARRFQSRKGDAAPIRSRHEALLTYLQGPESPFAGGVTRLAHDRLAFGMASNGVGYLAVMTMGGFSKGPDGWPGNTTGAADRAAAREAVAEALGRLKAARGLILDLRFNPGGSEEIADLIAGCFADRRRLAYYRKARDGNSYGPSFATYAAPNDCPRFDRPVVVLVGERTTSAAEALVMRLRVLPQVRTLGQATQGAHSDVLNKTLPNGWKLGLSNEIYTLADGGVYEGRGIPPAVATSGPQANDPDSIRYGRDIERALSMLEQTERLGASFATGPRTPAL